MDFSLTAIWASMGFLAKSVAIVLLVFAVASLGVFIERVLFFLKTRQPTTSCRWMITMH